MIHLFSENKFKQISFLTNFVREQKYICFCQYLFVCNKHLLPANNIRFFFFPGFERLSQYSTCIMSYMYFTICIKAQEIAFDMIIYL